MAQQSLSKLAKCASFDNRMMDLLQMANWPKPLLIKSVGGLIGMNLSNRTANNKR
jgi:hypothetical protein